MKSTNQSPLRSKTVQSVSSTPTAANQSRPASQSTPTSTNLSSKFQHTPSTPTTPKTVSSPVKKSSSQSADVLLWVDKYKPPGMKQIIGQQGDKSNARKLLKWLQGWHKNQAAGKKPACEFKFRWGSEIRIGFYSVSLVHTFNNIYHFEM